MATKLSPKMGQRRENILRAARTLIVRDGFDALTTRRLADEAGITAPTLYNLIGDKNEIIRQLVSDGVVRVGSRATLGADLPPLAMAEGIIETALSVVAEDQVYFRAVVIASDRVPGAFAAAGDGPASVANAAQISIDMMTAACRAAIGAQLLEGHVAAETLGLQIFIGFRGPFRDWANQLISVGEFRRRALRGLYMAMAVDAAPQFREILRAKVIALEPPFQAGLDEPA
ncbi:AcrR family transcriptional regulator [Erythromicrobium ramosum]|uniref:AcrR family transcriptional regulator n=1 Tax=Erythrobacter ramosus TaxID=35811 RepID=A0A6I4URS5_9SPHN|nr:AcrR family transcriptional regulator [Erythrobacter ramosus]MXP39885.1 TetR family transcriptional regulator [Erythrobacter ramosus]